MQFSITKDGSPEIYDFVFSYLPEFLKKKNYKKINITMERLEPINKIYSNINMPDEEIEKIFKKFCKTHGLKTGRALTAEKQKTTIMAEIKTSELERVLKDYNVLFDIFFSDLIIKTDDLKIDLMSVPANSVLAIGEKPLLQEFKKFIEKKVKNKIKTVFAD